MGKVIQVQFHKQMGAEELYFRLGSKKKAYVRQPLQGSNRVVWASATKWREGFEADAPLKAGVTIKVVSGPRKERVVHFEEVMETDENGVVSAAKREFFTREQLEHASKGYIKKMGLKDYDSWAKWLLNEATKHDYDGYSDNWLHYGTDELDRQEIETLNILGAIYHVEESKWQHKVCGKTWTVIEIKDAKGNVAELCGIAYNG